MLNRPPLEYDLLHPDVLLLLYIEERPLTLTEIANETGIDREWTWWLLFHLAIAGLMWPTEIDGVPTTHRITEDGREVARAHFGF
jgi:hypothetical protein